MKIKYYLILYLRNILYFFLNYFYTCKDCKYCEICKLKRNKICQVFIPDYINLPDLE